MSAFLLTTTLLAQKVDLDRYSFSVSYRSLPSVEIDTSFHTFQFDWDAGPLMKLSVMKDRPEEALEIEGWRRLTTGAHITVQLRMEDIIIMKSDVSQREETLKDKNGNVTGKRNWYAPLLTYTYAARVLVKDHKGVQLQQYQAVSRETQHTYKGTEYPSRSAAANILLNMMTVTTTLSRDVLYDNIQRLTNSLSRQYGYGELNVTDQVWILDSRKHPEYEKFRANWATIKNALFRLNPNEPVDDVKEEVKPAVAYFEKIRKRYNSSSKSDRKLRYASHYLLAKMYYYLDEPDLAVKEATDLVLNDYDSKDGRYLESAAFNLKQLLNMNKRKTRHFPLDISSFQGPRADLLYSVQ